MYVCMMMVLIWTHFLFLSQNSNTRSRPMEEGDTPLSLAQTVPMWPEAIYRKKVIHGLLLSRYNDVIMGAMASQISSVSIVYSTVCSGADQRKHQSSASLAFVRGIHRWPVNSSHKCPVTRKMFPFDDVIMTSQVANYTGLTLVFNPFWVLF